MLEPKVPAVGASIGFALSFLIGLVNGASLPVLLARAVCMALLFAVLTALAKFVVVRFLPELSGDFPSATGSDENVGNVVDISIDDNGRDDISYGETNDDDTSGMVPDFLEAASKPSADSVSESAPAVSESAPTIGDGGMTTGHHEIPASSGYTVRAQEKGSAGGLDILPDLQDFVPQVTSTTEDGSGGDTESDSGIGTTDSIFIPTDVKGSTMESETMAKAIRTILSRDN